MVQTLDSEDDLSEDEHPHQMSPTEHVTILETEAGSSDEEIEVRNVL